MEQHCARQGRDELKVPLFQGKVTESKAAWRFCHFAVFGQAAKIAKQAQDNPRRNLINKRHVRLFGSERGESPQGASNTKRAFCSAPERRVYFDRADVGSIAGFQGQWKSVSAKVHGSLASLKALMPIAIRQTTAPAGIRALPAYLASFDSLPDSANVKLPVVAALHGVSAITVRRWAKAGILPAPARRGGVNLWNVGDLRRSLARAA